MKVKFFLFSLFFILSQLMLAQPVNINLTENDVINRVAFTQDLQSGTLQKNFFATTWRSANGAYDVMMRSKDPSFTNNTHYSTLPSSIVSFRLISIAGKTPGGNKLEGEWPGFNMLTTSFAPFFKPWNAYSDASFGAILMRYVLKEEVFQNYKLMAGTYTLPIEHNQADNSWLGLGGNYDIVPVSWNMNINVPSFTKWISGATSYSHIYTSIDEFQNPQDLVFDLSDFKISHTLNSNLQVRAQGNINFIPHGGGPQTTLPMNLIEIFGTGIPAKSVQSWFDNYNSSTYDVPVGNRTTVPVKVRIKANDIKNNFYKAGTYSFTLDFKTKSTDASKEDVKSVTFTITTQSLSSIVLQGSPDVNFNFSSPSDYQTGKSQNMPNHLLVTNYKSYEIYVKSSSNFFTLNGTPTTVPASIVQIQNGNGQTGIVTKNLSTTPQAIVTGASPELNRNISLKYVIPADKTSVLLGQTTGATPYILNVIYSFTNQ